MLGGDGQAAWAGERAGLIHTHAHPRLRLRFPGGAARPLSKWSGLAVARSLDGDLPRHAQFPVVGDRAVEFVASGRQVDVQGAALAGLDVALELLVLSV